MKSKFQNLDAFDKEELFTIVENLFSEFLIEFFEKKEHSRLRDILLRSVDNPPLPENPVINNRRPSKTKVNADKISKVKQYAEEFYGRTIRLKEVSDIVGLSESAFAHFFKRNIGQSFITYLNGVRIEKASLLLQETKELVVEIGYLTGFNTPYYFNDVFKRYMGMTPGEYRKLHRGNFSRTNESI